jgi:hypothetical protein
MVKQFSTPAGRLQAQGLSLLMAGALRKEIEGDIFLKLESARKAAIEKLPMVAIHMAEEGDTEEQTKARGKELQKAARDIKSDKHVLKAYRKIAAMTAKTGLEGDVAKKHGRKLRDLNMVIAAVAFDETDVLRNYGPRLVEMLKAVQTTKPAKEGQEPQVGHLPCMNNDDTDKVATMFIKAVIGAEKGMPAAYQYTVCAVLATPLKKLSKKVGESHSYVRYAAWRSLELSPDGDETGRMDLIKARLSAAWSHLKNFGWSRPKALIVSLWSKFTGLFKSNKEEVKSLEESEMSETMKEESGMWTAITNRLAKVGNGATKVASWTKGFVVNNWKEMAASVVVTAGAVALGAGALVAIGAGVLAGGLVKGISKLWSWFKSDDQVAKRADKKAAKATPKVGATATMNVEGGADSAVA